MNQNNINTLLLCGNNLDSSLLKTAIHYAEEGLNVWFISANSIKQLPTDIEPPSRENLKFITFLYLKDSQDLLKHLNAVQIWQNVPSLIILASLQEYCNVNSVYNSSLNAFIIASLFDATSACMKKLKKKSFLLVASNQNPGNIEYENICNLYFENIIVADNENESLLTDIMQYSSL